MQGERRAARCVSIPGMMRLTAYVVSLLTITVFSAACTQAGPDVAQVQPPAPGMTVEDGPSVRVLVTTDYGAETLVDVHVPLEDGMSAMQVLQSVATVGTAYGGGFVQSINGIGSQRESRTDWFYAVNGVLSNRGAADHALAVGDVEHWDYRTWGFRRQVSATLGCFPAFLTNGFRGAVRATVVAFETPYADEAEAIASALRERGVSELGVVDLAQLPEPWKGERNLVLVAGPGHGMVREVYERWDRLGLYALLREGSITACTAAGEETVLTGSVGTLQPLQNPWNPSGIGACQNVVLLVSGTDAAGVRGAASLLPGAIEDMSAWCGALVRDGTAAPLPVRH